jgi:hypothetical protein
MKALAEGAYTNLFQHPLEAMSASHGKLAPILPGGPAAGAK